VHRGARGSCERTSVDPIWRHLSVPKSRNIVSPSDGISGDSGEQISEVMVLKKEVLQAFGREARKL